MKQLSFSFSTHDNSDFRLWVNEKWFEYKDEVDAWEHRQVTGTPQAYFLKYRWFLKAKYKAERR